MQSFDNMELNIDPEETAFAKINAKTRAYLEAFEQSLDINHLAEKGLAHD